MDNSAQLELQLKKDKEEIRQKAAFSESPYKVMTGNMQDEFTAIEMDPIQKKFTRILESDFQSKAWMTRKRGKRHSEKHMKEDYKAVFGQRPAFSSAMIKERQGNIEDYKNLSVKASTQIVNFLKDNPTYDNVQQDNDDPDATLVEQIMNVDLSEFVFESDKAFVDSFASKMKKLYRAQHLLERFQKGDEIGDISDEQRLELTEKLGTLSDLRQAYEDRIHIISSPYYSSLRDADFTDSTIIQLKKANQKKGREGSIKAYAEAMIRWKEEGERLCKNPAKVLEKRKDEKRKRADTQSNQAVDKVLEKTDLKEFNSCLNETDDTKVFSDDPKANAKIQANVRAMKLNRERIDKICDPAMTDEQIFAKLSGMRDYISKKIDRIKKTPADKINAKELKIPELDTVLKHLDTVENQYRNGEISKGTLQIFMDRGLMHETHVGRSVYDKIVLQTEIPEVITPQMEKADANYKKQMTNTVVSYINSLGEGCYGYIQNNNTYRFTKSGDKTRKAQFKKENEDMVQSQYNFWLNYHNNNRSMDHVKQNRLKDIREKYEDYAKQVSVDSSKCKDALQSSGKDFFHIIGGKCDQTKVLTRAYLSIKPEKKIEGIKEFMNVLKELDMAQYVHFKVSTTIMENRVDDITVYFDKSLTVDDVKKCLDTFHYRCKSILVGDQQMSAAAAKYQDGIGLAAEPELCGVVNRAFKDNNNYCDNMYFKDIDFSPTYSFTSFVVENLCKSAILASKQLGKDVKKNQIDLSDEATLRETKKIFREMCLVNGIDPISLVDEDVKKLVKS